MARAILIGLVWFVVIAFLAAGPAMYRKRVQRVVCRVAGDRRRERSLARWCDSARRDLIFPTAGAGVVEREHALR